jgi:hypothetical protein
MTGNQTKVVLASLLFVLLCWLGSFLISEPESEAQIVEEPGLMFDGGEAFQRAREFVTTHPVRFLGALEARQSSGYLRDNFASLGYEVSFSHFQALIEGRQEVGRNVLAYRKGTEPGILAVVAHYDTAPTTVQGAMDNGAAVGVLLELARAIQDSHRSSLLFIASDGEEWGMLGAAEIATNYPDRKDLIAVLSLDGVAIGATARLRLDTVGQFAGYSPPWLRRIARESARAEGMPVEEPSGFWEHLERALPVSTTDQGPFLREGIAAINLGSVSTDPDMSRRIYHTELDRIENIEIGSIEKYGRTAERILRSLDQLPSVAEGGMGTFRLAQGYFLPHRVVVTLHYLTFLPLLIMFYFHWKNREDLLSIELLQRELMAVLGTVLPFLFAFATLTVMLRLGLLPLYGLYPPPPGDPVLQNPDWAILAAPPAVGILAGVILFLLNRYLAKNLPRPCFEFSKLLLLGAMVLLVLVALQINSYWAATFLILPAYVWGLVSGGRSTGARGANRIYLLAAGIVHYAVLVFLASGLGLGWGVFWYLLLSLATGLFSPGGYMLLAVTATLGIRFMAIQSHPTS